MALHATESVEDALDATTSFLLPFDATRWLRLAVVAFFIGLGAPSVNFSGGGGGGGGNGGDVGQLPVDVGRELAAAAGLLVLLLVAVALLLALAFALVGSVMEFVFVEALWTREVTVGERFRAHARDGLALFGFRLLLVLLVVLLVGGAAAIGFLLQGPGLRVVALLLAVPVALVVGLLAAVVNGFTTVFVVPVMLTEGVGVLDGWRRFWPTLREDLTEYGAYLLISVVLTVVAGVAVAAVTGIVAGLVLLPLGLLGGGLFLGALAGGVPLLSLVVLVPLLVVAGFVLAAVAAFVRVPALVFLRYYALFVLGGTDPDLDLVADLRAEGEEAGGEGAAT